jgi:uncharacterized repeat protein (TIGR01451 family)
MGALGDGRTSARWWVLPVGAATLGAVLLLGGSAVGQATCTKVWDGSTGSWTDGARWSPAGEPAAGDHVCISTGIVTLDVDRTVAAATQSGGTLTGTGTLTVSGVYALVGGSNHSGSGQTVAEGGFVLSGGGVKTVTDRTLVNAGAGAWTGGGFINLSGTLRNEGTFTIADSPIVQFSGPIVNAAGATLTNTGGTTLISALFSNDGAINVDAGELQLGGSGTSSGTIEVATDAVLRLAAGTHTLTAASSLAGAGEVQAVGGTTHVSGGFAPGSLRVNGGILNLHTTGVQIPTVQLLTGGTLNVHGDLTATQTFQWVGGNLGGDGGTTTSVGTLTLDTGPGFTNVNQLLGTHTLVNAGTGTWNANTGFINLAGTLHNDGALAITGPGTMQFAGQIVNTAAATLTHTDDTTIIGPALHNAGTVQVTTGTLQLGGSGTSSGTFEVAGGATLHLAGSYAQTGGEVLLPAASSAVTTDGGSALQVQGGVLRGIGSVGRLVNSGGTVAPGGSVGTLTVTGDYTQTAGGTLDAEVAGPTSFDVLSVGGTATLGGAVRVTLLGGFAPADGDRFRVVTAGTRTGTFTGVDDADPTDEFVWSVEHGATFVDLAVGATTPPPPAADLSLTKSAAPTSVEVGGTVTYTLTVANAGPDAATGVVVTDALPAGMTFASADSGCTHAAGTVTCAVGGLASGAAAQRAITVTAASAGSKLNTATVAGDQGDPTPGNNSGNASVEVAPPAPPPPTSADVAVTKSADRATVLVGDLVAYTVTATNQGPGTASGVTLTDPLPDGVGFSAVRSGPCVHDATTGTVTGQAANLAPGSSLTCTIVVAALAAGTPVNTASVATTSTDPVATNDSASATVTITAPPQPSQRVFGVDRIQTAIAASRSTYDDGEAGAVVLARADQFPDALAGAPHAVRLQAPLLLTPSGALHPDVETEIRRVLPDGGTVHLLGGRAALADAVEQRVRALGYQTVRFAGANRFETATLIAGATANPGAVFVATGLQFPDALTAGAAAASVNGVIVLTAGDALPAVTAAYLDANPGATRFAVGGPAARAVPAAIRVAGTDRFATALAVAERFFAAPAVVGIAVGSNFPDALAGDAHIARRLGPMLLTHQDQLPESVAGYLGQRRATITRVFLYGGPGAISPAVEDELNRLLAEG